MPIETNNILSKHIIPQPLIIEDDKYILNEQYISANYATSDINGYINSKQIETHYKIVNDNNDITNYLESYYYIPSIGELGITFQNINKINQNGHENYLDVQNENIYLSSTLKDSQDNNFWVFNNQDGRILPKSEIENQDTINTTSLLFKKFEIDILNDSQINNSFEEENINYIDRLTDDNIEVLSYMYYVNYNSTNLENDKNSKYYYMQYRLAYTYLDKESEPIFSYLEYGNNLINDYSLNNMSYIYDKYELTWNKTKKCLEYQSNASLHNNFFDIKNPPVGSYIYPISYNINKINGQQTVTININPYCQQYKLTGSNNTYLDPYGFKFYFALPFEYVFNKIKNQIINNKSQIFKKITFSNKKNFLTAVAGTLSNNNPNIRYINYSDYELCGICLKLSDNIKTALKYNKINNGRSGSTSANNRTIDYWIYEAGDWKKIQAWYTANNVQNIIHCLEFSHFEYPFRLSELLLYTLFTESEIDALDINISQESFKIENTDFQQYQGDYDKYLIKNDTIFKLNYNHGKLIRQYIIDHYLLTGNANTLGKETPIITSIEQFLDLFGSIFYKQYFKKYSNTNYSVFNCDEDIDNFYKYNNDNEEWWQTNEHYTYIYDNIFSYLLYKNEPGNLFNIWKKTGVGSRNYFTYINYNTFTNNDKTTYCDLQRKRFYNISPLKFYDNENNIGYGYRYILALYMKFNYLDGSYNENYYALKYFTKDALIFICKKTNLSLEKSIYNIKSITFSLGFLSRTINQKEQKDIIKNFTIIPNMTFNLYFNKNHLYNLNLENIDGDNYKSLKTYITCANNKEFFTEYINLNNNENYYITENNLQYNSYLSGFSNINNLLIENLNKYYAQTPKINNTTAYNIIRNRIVLQSNYYSENYENNPISHKVSSLNSLDDKLYYHVNNTNILSFTDDYTDINNNGIYQTYLIDNIINNTNILDNSYFAREFISLPEINSQYFKNILLNKSNQNILYIYRIWGHRTLNNIYDDYTIYKPIEKSKKINIPLIGYKTVLYMYNYINKDIINYLLSDYIIIINKSLSIKEVQFTDNNRLSGLYDEKSFKLILNPLEIKLLYPAVYNFNYNINISCNNIFVDSISNIINNININHNFDLQDLIYVILQKLIKLINFDLNKINNYNNILIKLNNTQIDQIISNILLYDIYYQNNIGELKNEEIITIKHCQNPYKGNIIIIEDDKK